MIEYLISAWRSCLRIGYHVTFPGLPRGRVMLLNGLVIIASVSVVIFSICYAIIGYQYFYGPLYILPGAIAVLVLNSQGRFKDARRIYIAYSLLVISYWCYEGRGNGNEYTLIGLATTATLILEKRSSIVITNALCALVFVGYKVYDLNTPFVPDPAIDYKIIPTIILLNTVGVISFQIAFYRDLAKHYDEKLTTKYEELQAAEEELKSTNEEISTMNEKLHDLAGELENRVKQKTRELQSYIDAIDVNLYSCINDLAGNFIEVNDQLVKASGFSKDELIGKHYTLLATPLHQQTHFQQRRQRLISGAVWRGEVEHRSKHGDFYWFDCVVIPIKNNKDECSSYLSIGLPITERKMHEQLREKTYGVLESIAFRASHGIRGPMMRIKGLANLVEMNLLDDTEMRTLAKHFSGCSDELSKATSELVDFVYQHQETLNDSKVSNN